MLLSTRGDTRHPQLTYVVSYRNVFLQERIVFNHSVLQSIILSPNNFGDDTVKPDTV